MTLNAESGSNRMARGITRRGFLTGALSVTAATMLAGCSSPVSQGLLGVGPSAGLFTYWNLFSGGDGGRMIEMEKAFEQAYPAIDLSAVTLSWGNPYYTKLSLATRGGSPPDLGISHLTRMTTLARAGLLEPIDAGTMSKLGMTPDRYNQVAWNKAQVEGIQYAVPLDTHPYVTYYNTKIGQKAGILDSSGALMPIRGEQQFLEVLREIKKVTGAYAVVSATINDTSSCWRLFSSLYWQLGGEVLSDEGRTVTLDKDRTLTVLNLLKRLTIDEQLMPSSVDDNGTVITFSNGRAGLLFDGEWDNSIYTGNKTPYNMTLFPHVYGDTYYCQADSHSFVIPRDSRRTPEETELTYRFIRQMMDNSYTWAQGGHIPAWLPVRNSAKYRSLKPQSNYASAAEFAHYDPSAWYSGSGSDFETLMGSAISAVETGQSSPAEAYDTMLSGLKAFANTPSPV